MREARIFCCEADASCRQDRRRAANTHTSPRNSRPAGSLPRGVCACAPSFSYVAGDGGSATLSRTKRRAAAIAAFTVGDHFQLLTDAMRNKGCLVEGRHREVAHRHAQRGGVATVAGLAHHTHALCQVEGSGDGVQEGIMLGTAPFCTCTAWRMCTVMMHMSSAIRVSPTVTGRTM